MYHIKIDRKSIKKNPDYGRRHHVIRGRKEGRARCEWFPGDEARVDEVYDLFQSPDPIEVADSRLIVTSFSGTIAADRDDAVPIAECDLVSMGPMDPDAVEAAWPHGGKFKAWVKENPVHIETDGGPEYLFYYEPQTVTCEHCGSTFDHICLESDGNDDGVSVTVCPVCDAWECCEIEYERIADVVDKP